MQEITNVGKYRIDEMKSIIIHKCIKGSEVGLEMVECGRCNFLSKPWRLGSKPEGHSDSSLMLVHIVLTSCSVLPSFDAMAFQEYRDRSSAFRRRSFFFSSRVHEEEGLGDRGGDFSLRRCRLAGALGVVFGLGRLAGVLSFLEKRQESCSSAGSGAVTCVWGSGSIE